MQEGTAVHRPTKPCPPTACILVIRIQTIKEMQTSIYRMDKQQGPIV